jgi:hypothetical protein
MPTLGGEAYRTLSKASEIKEITAPFCACFISMTARLEAVKDVFSPVGFK